MTKEEFLEVVVGGNLSELDLSVRACNIAVKSLGCKSIEDLKKVSYYDMENATHCGFKTRREIFDKLQQYEINKRKERLAEMGC